MNYNSHAVRKLKELQYLSFAKSQCTIKRKRKSVINEKFKCTKNKDNFIR